jgi:hypothetical protein
LWPPCGPWTSTASNRPAKLELIDKASFCQSLHESPSLHLQFYADQLTNHLSTMRRIVDYSRRATIQGVPARERVLSNGNACSLAKGMSGQSPAGDGGYALTIQHLLAGRSIQHVERSGRGCTVTESRTCLFEALQRQLELP